MSISQNFPEEGPTLNLNFAGSKTLDPRITFSRTTTGTYMDDSGLIKVAPADSPRFDHRYVNGEIESLGLLVEESRTNIVRKSEDLTIGIWDENGDGVTVTTNQAVAPDGNTTADKVAIKTTDAGSKGVQSSTLSGSISGSGTAITSSIFCKADDHNYVRVEMQGGGNTGSINVDLSDGSLISEVSSPDSYKIEPYPNDWYRISVTSTTANTNVTALRVYLTDASGNSTFTGTVGNGVFMWGGQHEIGAFATSYIPTDDTAGGKTRNPDNVTMEGDNFSDWYNQSEGTIYVSQKLKSIDTVDRNSVVYLINGGSGSDLFYNVKLGTTNIFVFGDGGTNYSRWEENGDSTDTKTIWAYDVSGDDFKPYWNGIEGVNETTTNTPSATSHTQLEIGANIGAKYNGHISQLTYYPTRLTNAQLQNLTK